MLKFTDPNLEREYKRYVKKLIGRLVSMLAFLLVCMAGVALLVVGSDGGNEAMSIAGGVLLGVGGVPLLGLCAYFYFFYT